jgi:hypothetical protein
MNVNEQNMQEEAAIPAGAEVETGDFADPPVEREAEGAPGSDQFDAPEGMAPDALDSEGSAEFAFDPAAEAVMSAKAEIECKLSECAAKGALSEAVARNVDGPGVVGAGVSYGGEGGGIPGQPSLVVYVENSANEEEVRREILDLMGVQAASSDTLPFEVIETGVIDALTSNRSKFRPAPAGVSVGHYRITAGTIGTWARGPASRQNRLLMISNNHVLADSNRGRFGDSIIQPGRADGGVNPRDRIAILERFVTINFRHGATNYVDCATGWCWPSRVRRDHVYHRGSRAQYFKVGSAIISPRVGMVVGKAGRTTNLTQGTIRAIGVSINVNFGTAGVAHFRDQFSVQSTESGTFSAGGDSGSAVWAWQGGLPLVGLLFAGGGGTTFCNRMSRVVSALGVTPL